MTFSAGDIAIFFGEYWLRTSFTRIFTLTGRAGEGRPMPLSKALDLGGETGPDPDIPGIMKTDNSDDSARIFNSLPPEAVAIAIGGHNKTPAFRKPESSRLDQAQCVTLLMEER
jgi:hypothetical protein